MNKKILSILIVLTMVLSLVGSFSVFADPTLKFDIKLLDSSLNEISKNGSGHYVVHPGDTVLVGVFFDSSITAASDAQFTVVTGTNLDNATMSSADVVYNYIPALATSTAYARVYDAAAAAKDKPTVTQKQNFGVTVMTSSAGVTTPIGDNKLIATRPYTVKDAVSTDNLIFIMNTSTSTEYKQAKYNKESGESQGKNVLANPQINLTTVSDSYTGISHPVYYDIEASAPADVLITSVTAPSNVNIAYGDSYTAPTTVDITTADSSLSSLPASFTSSPAFDNTTAGTYTFSATVAAPSGYAFDTGVSGNVSYTVTVGAQPSATVSGPSAKTVENGTAKADVIAALDAETTATNATVTWDCATYDGDTAGDYTFTGTVEPAGIYANPGDLSCTVTVKEEATASVSSATFNVANGTTKADVIANYLTPATSTTGATVAWNCADYAAGTAGTYDFVGTVTANDGYTYKGSNLSASVTVAAPAPTYAIAYNKSVNGTGAYNNNVTATPSVTNPAAEYTFVITNVDTSEVVYNGALEAQKIEGAGSYTLDIVADGSDIVKRETITIVESSASADADINMSGKFAYVRPGQTITVTTSGADEYYVALVPYKSVATATPGDMSSETTWTLNTSPSQKRGTYKIVTWSSDGETVTKDYDKVKYVVVADTTYRGTSFHADNNIKFARVAKGSTFTADSVFDLVNAKDGLVGLAYHFVNYKSRVSGADISGSTVEVSDSISGGTYDLYASIADGEETRTTRAQHIVVGDTNVYLYPNADGITGEAAKYEYIHDDVYVTIANILGETSTKADTAKYAAKLVKYNAADIVAAAGDLNWVTSTETARAEMPTKNGTYLLVVYVSNNGDGNIDGYFTSKGDYSKMLRRYFVVRN